MPNIEIHGLDQTTALNRRERIFLMFRNTSYVGDMVVTIFPTSTTDHQGKSRPFLRLASACQVHTEEIVSILQALNMDIEILKLDSFISMNG